MVRTHRAQPASGPRAQRRTEHRTERRPRTSCHAAAASRRGRPDGRHSRSCMATGLPAPAVQPLSVTLDPVATASPPHQIFGPAPMSPTPLPAIDHADALALAGPATLLQLLEATAAALAAHGVEITPEARRGLDEIAEAVDEWHARHDPAALARTLAALSLGALRLGERLHDRSASTDQGDRRAGRRRWRALVLPQGLRGRRVGSAVIGNGSSPDEASGP